MALANKPDYIATRAPQAPPDSDLHTLASWTDREMRALAASMLDKTALELRPIHAPPPKPREGMIVYADGTHWNPGSGVGPYCRVGATFVPMTGGGGGLTPQPAWTLFGNDTGASATPTGFTIDALTLKATPAAADEIPIWDVAGTSMKKITVGSLPSGGGSVTPAALTAANDTNVTLTLTGTPATALLQATTITAGWAGTLANARLANMAAYTIKGNTTGVAAGPSDFTIDSLAAKATPVGADELLLWDVAGAAMRKATISSLPAGGGGTTILSGRVTADSPITNSTTLADIPGLTVNVVAGQTYAFRADVMCTGTATTGYEFAVSGTCSATDLRWDGVGVDGAANRAMPANTLLGTGGTVFPTTTANNSHVAINGTITVAGSGTLTIQACQGTLSATALNIRRGSTFIVTNIP